MAYGDEYTTTTGAQDGEVTYTFAPKTAQANEFIADYPNEDRLYREDRDRAAAAGVTGVDKIDYAEALRNYESRSDVELFVNRRARSYATTFGEQDFTRQAVQIADPLQSSTVGTTSVVKGDDYTDVTDAAGTGPADGRDDVVIEPDRT